MTTRQAAQTPIRKARKEAGLSHSQFVAETGISERAISRIENGGASPREAIRRVIARALGMEVAQISYPADALVASVAPYKQFERSAKVLIESNPYILADLVAKDSTYKARLDRTIAIYFCMPSIAERWTRKREELRAQESANIRRPNPKVVTVDFAYLESWLREQPEAAAILKLEAASP